MKDFNKDAYERVVLRNQKIATVAKAQGCTQGTVYNRIDRWAAQLRRERAAIKSTGDAS